MGLSLDDLVKIGYLKTWDIKPMVSKKGFKLVMSPGREILNVIATTQRRQLASSNRAQELTPAQMEVQSLLQERGIDEQRTVALARIHDPETVREKLEYLDSEIARDAGKRIKNPSGFIIAWIEGGKPIPHTFESTRKRQERVAMLEEERQRRELAAEQQMSDMLLRSNYQAWRAERADEAIQRLYSTAELNKRLQVLRQELGTSTTTAKYLERLPVAERREALLKLLRKEVATELELQTFEEWAEEHGQGLLFS